MTETVHRVCTLCEAHCGIRVEVDDGRVTRISGDPDDVMSHGYICPKAAALADLHADPDRLRTPVRRVGDEFVPIGPPRYQWVERDDEQIAVLIERAMLLLERMHR